MLRSVPLRFVGGDTIGEELESWRFSHASLLVKLSPLGFLFFQSGASAAIEILIYYLPS